MTAYVGEELELFARARRWKDYLRAELRPALGRRVLEVGAGVGASARALCAGDEERWVCLEPDPAQAARIEALRAAGALPACCSVVTGTVADLPDEAAFDAALYLDVLEHIADDAGELARAGARLVPGGRLVVLSPAHPWLFSPFDAAVGHLRRYTRASLAAAAPAGWPCARLDYLDAAGLLASALNRALLRQSLPTARQLAVWDALLVPLSRRLDARLQHRVGKSILGVWVKPG
ncbi:MAG: methyltransferase [Planctomycetes bacterium]|nr:methyltransferase [Planctomycetota bacterium]